MNTRPALAPVKTAADYAKATPPHNIEAEQALLGILLYSNQKYYAVFEDVSADDFYEPVHGRIYDAIAKTIEAGRAADVNTLRGQFENDAALASLGGARYLIDLAASTITAINARDYARLIHELATRRRLLAYCNEVMSVAHDMDAPPSSGEALIAQAETKLFALAERRGGQGAIDFASAWDKTIEKIEDAYRNGRPIGIRTGIAKLDKMLCGLQSGKLYTVAARPAMGKTALGNTIAVNAALGGARVLFHTLEMEYDEIVARVIARVARVPSNRQRGEITQEEFDRIFLKRADIADIPLYIDDASGIKIGQIRGRAIRHKRRFGLDLLIIDYLGLIAASNPALNRNYQIEEITQGLKNLAKELKIPVILLAQLNRELEKREDKRPILADLRDSGSVEQDSDAVIFIYRHEYYITRQEPQQKPNEKDESFEERYKRWQVEVERSRGRAELIVSKLRQGQTGVVPLAYEGWRCYFHDDGEGADGSA